MNPSKCPRCKAEFEADHQLQLEISGVHRSQGPTAARDRLDAALEGRHGAH